MKYFLLTLLLLCIATPFQAQVFENEQYGDLVYPGCIRAKNKKRCMSNKLAQFYLRNLPKDYFEPMEEKEGKIYSYMNVNLLFDSDGNYVDTNSQSQEMDALSMANLKLPKMSMPKDVQEFGISSDFRTILRYELSMKGEKVLNVFYRPLSSQQIQLLIGSSNQRAGVPAIYPGCSSADNNQLVKCLSKSISSHIIKNFDDRIANLPGVQESVIMIYIYFTIDREGKPSNIKIVNKHEKIREEAIRVVKSLPQMTPAMVDGEPVEMPFKMPIKFSVRY